jgi:anti-anti-sigma regulatory factor
MTRFSEDPYIRSGAPKSLLCLPLLHQGRLSGVLYLENRATPGVFDAPRVELLALLSSQAAIAIENARLISSVRTANGEVKRANERLELTVAHRTEELVTAKERLELELSRREQMELERAALQEQVIDTQRARLAEMSTPLIPITDEIMAMPLIGTLDRERATQVLTAALEGAKHHRARVVILDITGIQQIDTDVAGTLLGVSGALRMIGTETVLTGIAPTIAQTLVGLGVDLSSFVTRGTLQSGIDYAIRRVRGSGALRARGH